MKSTLARYAFIPALALAASAAPAPLAKDAPDAPKPLPVLRVDSSPVSDGKVALVTSYADVVEPVQKAVVSIYSTRTVHESSVNPFLRQFFGNQMPQQMPNEERESKEQGLGSGVIVSPDGYILTNNHVVADADDLEVTLPEPDDRKFKATLIGTDPKTDVAVIKIDATNLPTVTLADSDKLRVGDIVFAVGNPLEVGETVTMGIVSAKGRTVGLLEDVHGYENFIQTDAAINLGNSGGPLLDAKGRLVGINSAIISPSRGNIGIGFAIPANMAVSVMQSLIATGTVSRGYLGVESGELKPDVADELGLPKDTKGVIINDVTPNSAASKGGLKASDVILAINDKPVSTMDELHFMIGQMLPGAKISVKIMRDGKPQTIALVLGKADEKPDELIAGISISGLTDDLRRKFSIDPRVGNGLVVTEVAEDSVNSDLQAGMVIIAINRVPVADLASARAVLHPGRNLLLLYDHGAHVFVVVTVK
jgi:serine protease Do/serine protease DegQ